MAGGLVAARDLCAAEFVGCTPQTTGTRHGAPLLPGRVVNLIRRARDAKASKRHSPNVAVQANGLVVTTRPVILGSELLLSGAFPSVAASANEEHRARTATKPSLVCPRRRNPEGHRLRALRLASSRTGSPATALLSAKGVTVDQVLACPPCSPDVPAQCLACHQAGVAPRSNLVCEACLPQRCTELRDEPRAKLCKRLREQFAHGRVLFRAPPRPMRVSDFTDPSRWRLAGAAVLLRLDGGAFLAMTAITLSTIPGGGRGLAAAHDFSRGERVGFFAGRPCSQKDGSGYHVTLQTDQTMDTRGTPSRVDLINDPRLSEAEQEAEARPRRRRANVKVQKNGIVVTLRAVKMGEELFMSYGRDYWG